MNDVHITKTRMRLLIALILLSFCMTTQAQSLPAIGVDDKLGTLVTAEWLNHHLDDPDLVVLDCRVKVEFNDEGTFKSVSGLPGYQAGHIPSAGFADLITDLSDTTSPFQFALPSEDQLAAAIGALAWMSAEWLIDKKPTVLGLASGIVAGLVAITPAAGFVNLPASLLIGLGAGLLGFYSVAKLKKKLGYDDSLDAFGVHGMCGLWGALATGLFANPAINEAGRGLFYGNPKQLWIQIISIVATAVFTAVGTLIVIYITKLLTGGLRVTQEDEVTGLDSSIHGERGFEIQ